MRGKHAQDTATRDEKNHIENHAGSEKEPRTRRWGGANILIRFLIRFQRSLHFHKQTSARPDRLSLQLW